MWAAHGQRGFAAGKSMCDRGGHSQGSQSHPAARLRGLFPAKCVLCWLIRQDWQETSPAPCCPESQELPSFKHESPPEHQPAPELNSVLVPELRGFQRMNKRLSLGWLVGLRRQAAFSPGEVALPKPTKACEQTRGAPPALLHPAFLDGVVQVRLTHVQPQRRSRVKVTNADTKRCPRVAVDRHVRTCKTKEGEVFKKLLS